MFTFFLIIYLLTIFLCLSSYIFYPIIIWVLGKMFTIKVKKRDIYPDISIIISAYNEEKNIEKKIKNTLALAYPKDKVEILVGSDGSTDDTPNVVRKYADQGVQFVDFKDNRGKTAVQNDLVNQSTGEILIFTDAASFLPGNAIRKIIRNFSDNRIGCVAGRMRFVDTNTNLTTESQGLYWRYEVTIREMESRIGSLIGVDGPLYAVRRDCYVPLGHHVISDLMTPLIVLDQGRKVILEPEALVDEDPTTRTEHEFSTRRRIVLRGLVGISTYMVLLNPIRHPVLSFQIFFHKVLRWFVGPLVILNGLACLALTGHWFFKFFLTMYILFFVAAAFGWITERIGVKFRALTVPYYFSLVNFAAIMGIIDFFRKKQIVTWKPVRH